MQTIELALTNPNEETSTKLKTMYQVVIKHPEIWQKDSHSGKWVQKDSLYYVSDEGVERIENVKRNKFGCEQHSGGFCSFICVFNKSDEVRTYLFGTKVTHYPGDEILRHYNVRDVTSTDKYMHITCRKWSITQVGDTFAQGEISEGEPIKVPLINDLVMKTPLGYVHVSEKKVVDYKDVSKWSDEDFDDAKY